MVLYTREALMYRVLKRKIHNKSGTRVWSLKVTRAVTGNISLCTCRLLKDSTIAVFFISSRKLKMCPNKLKFLTCLAVFLMLL